MSNNTKAHTGFALGAETRKIAVSMVTIILGAFIFFGAGFAPMTNIHNAAHDTRHVFSMPCH